jgi:hypothetical protein
MNDSCLNREAEREKRKTKEDSKQAVLIAEVELSIWRTKTASKHRRRGR